MAVSSDHPRCDAATGWADGGERCDGVERERGRGGRRGGRAERERRGQRCLCAVRPPLGGHVLQRASVDGGSKSTC